MAQACLDDAAARAALPAGRSYTAIKNSRGLSCQDMRFNTRTPSVEVSQEPEPVLVDAVPVELHRATALPLTRTHNLA